MIQASEGSTKFLIAFLHVHLVFTFRYFQYIAKKIEPLVYKGTFPKEVDPCPTDQVENQGG
jgi:hypothetical protein